MKALVLEKNGVLNYREHPDPKIGAGECLVRIMAAGICSSDIARAFYHGAYRTPLIMGHEMAGEVVAVGEKVRGIRTGDRAAIYPLLPCRDCEACRQGDFNKCRSYDYFGSRRDGGFSEYLSVPENNLVRIPEGLSYEKAVLAEPAAVAFHAVRRMEVRSGAEAVVFGAGPIGNLAGQMLKLFGCRRVYIVDRHENKLKLAKKCGLTPVEAGKTADYVLEASGSPALIDAALKTLKTDGLLMLMGNISGELCLDKKAVSSILRREIKIMGTWNSRLDEWPAVLKLLKTRLKVAELISRQFPLSAGKRVFTALKQSKGKKNKAAFMKVIFSNRGGEK